MKLLNYVCLNSIDKAHIWHNLKYNSDFIPQVFHSTSISSLLCCCFAWIRTYSVHSVPRTNMMLVVVDARCACEMEVTPSLSLASVERTYILEKIIEIFLTHFRSVFVNSRFILSRLMLRIYICTVCGERFTHLGRHLLFLYIIVML